MIGKTPECMECKHFNFDDFSGFTCKAFPKGIPDEILHGDNPHTKPLPDQDNDIVFERNNDNNDNPPT